jgi:hypothetical protein
LYIISVAPEPIAHEGKDEFDEVLEANTIPETREYSAGTSYNDRQIEKSSSSSLLLEGI